MTDDDRPNPPDPPGTETPPDSESSPPDLTDDDDLRSQVEKWKHFSREWEIKAKTSHAAAQRVEQLERANAQMSTTIGELQLRATRAERALLVHRIAGRKGLPGALAERLQGSTEAELEQDADALVAELAEQKEGADPPGGRVPVPRLRPGAVEDAVPAETDPARLAAQVRR